MGQLGVDQDRLFYAFNLGGLDIAGFTLVNVRFFWLDSSELWIS
jgi:hypothetical protein